MFVSPLFTLILSRPHSLSLIFKANISFSIIIFCFSVLIRLSISSSSVSSSSSFALSRCSCRPYLFPSPSSSMKIICLTLLATAPLQKAPQIHPTCRILVLMAKPISTELRWDQNSPTGARVRHHHSSFTVTHSLTALGTYAAAPICMPNATLRRGGQ